MDLLDIFLSTYGKDDLDGSCKYFMAGKLLDLEISCCEYDNSVLDNPCMNCVVLDMHCMALEDNDVNNILYRLELHVFSIWHGTCTA